MILSPSKNPAMTPAKRNFRIKVEKKIASEVRLLKESSRPKIIVKEFTEHPKPSSYYLDKAKQRFNSLKESKSSRLVFSASNRYTLNSSRSRFNSRPKFFKEANSKNTVESIIPNWLQARTDFQESVRNMKANNEKRIPFIVEMEYQTRSAGDKEILREYLKTVKFFEKFPSQVIIDTSNRLIKQEFKENTFIVRKGDDTDSLIIFFQGNARVLVDGQIVAYKHPGDVVGDTSLYHRMPRTGDVIADSKCIVFKLLREDYEAAILQIKKEEKRANFEFLSSIPIFKDWKHIKLLRLSNLLNVKQLNSDSTIYKRGDASASMFFIKHGTVNVYAYVPFKQSNKWPVSVNVWRIRQVNKEYLVKIGKLKAGQFFGEVEILKSINRTMKSVTKTECVLLELNKDQLFENLTSSELNTLSLSCYTESCDEGALTQKLNNKITSKVSTENALLDALKADYSSLQGRDSLLDPKLKKISGWLKGYKTRRTESSKSFNKKVVFENSRNLSVAILKHK